MVDSDRGRCTPLDTHLIYPRTKHTNTKQQPPPAPAAAAAADPTTTQPNTPQALAAAYFPRALAFLYVLNDCFFAFDETLAVTDEGSGAPTSGGWVGGWRGGVVGRGEGLIVYVWLGCCVGAPT